MRMNVGSHVNL